MRGNECMHDIAQLRAGLLLCIANAHEGTAMARPIWNGSLSFGLLNIPVSLMSGERRVDIHFRMLDSRNNKPIRYERVNAETGAEVPWKDIVKAYEYRKGSYVVLKPEDIKSAAPESHETIDVEAFVDADAIGPQYYEKPYYLVPGKKAEKGYVLLRETLKKTKRIGIGRVVIRTREYLCAVIPQGDALEMNLLRYPSELIEQDEYRFPKSGAAAYRVTPAEIAMAEKLIEAMAGEWKPRDYKDEFRARLSKVIQKRMKSKGVVKAEEPESAHEDAATNVVDFMALLRKSIATDKRTPAKKRKPARAARKPAARKTTAAKARAKKRA
jgi:DNA end-binding protein Ku